VKGWKMIYQANDPSKQAEIPIFILDKMDCKLNLLKRDKEGHFILTKGAIY
jgi:hypothetical protein